MKKIFKFIGIILFIFIIFVSLVMIWFMYSTKDEEGVNNMRCKSNLCNDDKSDCIEDCKEENNMYKCTYHNYYGEESIITCPSKLIEKRIN